MDSSTQSISTDDRKPSGRAPPSPCGHMLHTVGHMGWCTGAQSKGRRASEKGVLLDRLSPGGEAREEEDVACQACRWFMSQSRLRISRGKGNMVQFKQHLPPAFRVLQAPEIYMLLDHGFTTGQSQGRAHLLVSSRHCLTLKTQCNRRTHVYTAEISECLQPNSPQDLNLS